MNRRRIALAAGTILAALFLVPGFLAAQEEIIPVSRTRTIGGSQAWIGPRISLLLAADETLREVYGDSGPAFGLTAGADLHRRGGFALAAVVDAGRFQSTGASTLSATASTLTLLPVAAALQARFGSGGLVFWLEAGGKIVFYTEDSALAQSQGSALGVLAGGGAQLALGAGAALQAFVRWSQADETLDSFTVHLGGWEIGGSLVWRFGI